MGKELLARDVVSVAGLLSVNLGSLNTMILYWERAKRDSDVNLVNRVREEDNYRRERRRDWGSCCGGSTLRESSLTEHHGTAREGNSTILHETLSLSCNEN